jgi:hypothetical protein
LGSILCISSNQIRLRSGIPKRFSVNTGRDEPLDQESGCCSHNKRSSPNVLYIYYAYRWNVYIWRVREAAFYFPSTTEKKEWHDILENAIKGF